MSLRKGHTRRSFQLLPSIRDLSDLWAQGGLFVLFTKSCVVIPSRAVILLLSHIRLGGIYYCLRTFSKITEFSRLILF
eukprot:UN11582